MLPSFVKLFFATFCRGLRLLFHPALTEMEGHTMFDPARRRHRSCALRKATRGMVTNEPPQSEDFLIQASPSCPYFHSQLCRGHSPRRLCSVVSVFRIQD